VESDMFVEPDLFLSLSYISQSIRYSGACRSHY